MQILCLCQQRTLQQTWMVGHGRQRQLHARHVGMGEGLSNPSCTSNDHQVPKDSRVLGVA
jgi:hypothetical protein